jgi:hypothetical protein
MDNKPLELQAEKLIEHKLIKHGLIVAKPSCDQEGADLLIIKDISQKITPFIKVQCKGRTIKKTSHVRIPTKYVEENFVVFLYVEEEGTKDDLLYVFFQDDIKRWRIVGAYFQLYIPKDFQNREEFKERLFNNRQTITKIENILLNQLIKTNQSIIIDGIFLENAVTNTQNIYRRLYPEKIFHKPNIDAIVEQLLKYTHVERKQEVNCYLIYSYDFSLEYVVDIDEMAEDDFFIKERLDFVGRDYNLYKLKTPDIVSFKVEQQLNHIINVENVLLVADDFAYVPYLQDLKNKGVEVVVFQHSENSGSRMYHRFKWADITYPLALAMGLERHEL